ncbi:YWTD domain-containing protein [Glonium stellatum]|uniref:YWTD domain-containing protein n=1 Tax=Glonium stellatum TaxID=574774 RepID=A0A8E2EYF0_9PEZI|nr:YWTD domain-containing protein [Glonium stellatum]
MNTPNLSIRQGRLYILDMGLRDYPELSGRILTCFPDGSGLETLISSLKNMPDGIAIDSQREHIYWIDAGVGAENDGSIHRCSLTGQDDVTIVPVGITHTPKQMVIAGASEKMYWSDREGMQVMRSDLDGTKIEILVRTGRTAEDKGNAENWCVGIAVDEEKGLMYWTQKGPSKAGKGRIFRARTTMPEGETPDNRGDIEVLFDMLPEPIDLELDTKRQILYWTDRGEVPFSNSVNRTNLEWKNENGGLKREILVRKLHEGIGIALDLENERMFFGDLMGSIYSANLDGTNKACILEDMGDVTGIAYLSTENLF